MADSVKWCGSQGGALVKRERAPDVPQGGPKLPCHHLVARGRWYSLICWDHCREQRMATSASLSTPTYLEGTRKDMQ